MKNITSGMPKYALEETFDLYLPYYRKWNSDLVAEGNLFIYRYDDNHWTIGIVTEKDEQGLTLYRCTPEGKRDIIQFSVQEMENNTRVVFLEGYQISALVKMYHDYLNGKAQCRISS